MDEKEVFENHYFVIVERLLIMIQHLYEIMASDYEEIQRREERAAMEEFWRIAQILCIVYSSIPDLILPLNESPTKMICYFAEYFIDQGQYFYQLIAHTFIGIGSTLHIASAVDTSYITVAYHVLGYLKLLECRLNQLNDWTNKNINGDEGYLHNFVIDMIKIHVQTLHSASMVRFTYNEIPVIENLSNPATILRLGFLWFGILACLFYMNWPGQCFLDSSDDLLKSIYDCNWYKLPRKTQSLMRFMMMRCLIPCQLTADPLVQMNFATSSAILRMTMSYSMTWTSLH